MAQVKDQSFFTFRSGSLITFLALTAVASLLRLFYAIAEWRAGQDTSVESYSFCVVFPATLIATLGCMRGTRTKEGLLMRLGTMIQLFLIICIPSFSLYLALGMPVVFLVVEVFVTRLPGSVTRPLEKVFIQ